MAYLKRHTLICPACGLTATVEEVVSVGPASRKGDHPARSVRNPDPFVEDRTEDGDPILLCPADGRLLWTGARGRPAYGPLSRAEMQGLRGASWLAPGTENPFPPEPRPYTPDDPFSLRPRKPR